jgi:membrane-associated phospholipid phosphatase
MAQQTPIRRWSTTLAAVVAAVLASMVWVDRPVASFVSVHTRPLRLLRWTVELHRWADEASLIILVACAVAATVSPGRLTATLFLTSCTVIFVRAFKDQLQLAFGRTWPETWVEDNPSFIRDGVFRFEFFRGGEAYSAFPSGTTATITALFAVAWFWYPRGRIAYAAVIGLVVATLITSDFHYVSDVIAGGFIGMSTGWFAIRLWEAWGPGGPVGSGGG